MLAYNEITSKKIIIMEGAPYQVLDSHVFRKQQRKPVNQTKLKNLITGKVTEYSFHQSEKAEEADIETRPLTYIYAAKGEWWFHRTGSPSDRITLSEDVLGDQKKFLKEGTEIEGVFFDDQAIGIRMPIKMQFKVTEAPPSMKGNTAQGGNKVVVLETGATINTPLFVEAGDTIEINTETGEYVSRA